MCKYGTIAVLSVFVWLALLSTAIAGDVKPKLLEVKGYYGGENRSWYHSPSYEYSQWVVVVSGGKAVLPRLDVTIDLLYSHYGWESNVKPSSNTSQLGFTCSTRYRLVESKLGALFLEAGLGLGYSTSSPSQGTLGQNPIGIITYGAGLQIPLTPHMYLLTQYKFYHISSVFQSDTGVNTNGLLMGVGWRW